MSSKKIICLFDVDGTLTAARKKVEQNMLDFIAELRKKVTVGVVGGSDFKKQKEQLGDSVLDNFDYSFSENGLLGYKGNELIHKKSIVDEIGNAKLNEFINYVLAYLSKVELPVKRGTFVEFRTGMLNVSPIGRGCSQEERDAFEQYDKEHKIREAMVADLRERFKDFNLTFSIGGQISFDVFPTGWDKTYCLQHIEAENFDEIHFFGDKTFEGGNDYEIFESAKTIGHTVKNPDDTIRICKELFFNLLFAIAAVVIAQTFNCDPAACRNQCTAMGKSIKSCDPTTCAAACWEESDKPAPVEEGGCDGGCVAAIVICLLLCCVFCCVVAFLIWKRLPDDDEPPAQMRQRSPSRPHSRRYSRRTSGAVAGEAPLRSGSQARSGTRVMKEPSRNQGYFDYDDDAPAPRSWGAATDDI